MEISIIYSVFQNKFELLKKNRERACVFFYLYQDENLKWDYLNNSSKVLKFEYVFWVVIFPDMCYMNNIYVFEAIKLFMNIRLKFVDSFLKNYFSQHICICMYRIWYRRMFIYICIEISTIIGILYGLEMEILYSRMKWWWWI